MITAADGNTHQTAFYLNGDTKVDLRTPSWPCRRSLDLFESGSERKHLRLLRGKRANGKHHYSLWIEDSPQFTAESFNLTKISLTYSKYKVTGRFVRAAR